MSYDPLHPMGSGNDMGLAYDTPAGKLVYDRDPELAYDPHLIQTTDGLGRRGQVFFDPNPIRDAGATVAQPEAKNVVASRGGFGNVAPRRMLDIDTPAKHPWLTVPLAEQELAIGEYQADRVQCAMDTVK